MHKPSLQKQHRSSRKSKDDSMLHTSLLSSREKKVIIILLIIFIALYLPFSNGGQFLHDPAPAPGTTAVTFNNDFARDFLDNDLEQHGTNPGYPLNHHRDKPKHTIYNYDKLAYTKLYQSETNDFVMTMTNKQLSGNIAKLYDTIERDYDDLVETDPTNSNPPTYSHSVNEDMTSMSLWIDGKASTSQVRRIITDDVRRYGTLFYMYGHTGPWTMTINIYDCHTQKLYKHIKAGSEDAYSFDVNDMQS